MVRFQYDHNIGQWRWNISKNAEKLDEKILDALRNSMGNNEFTYAAVGNDEFVCMSSLKPNGNEIIEGTVVGIKGKFKENGYQNKAHNGNGRARPNGKRQ